MAPTPTPTPGILNAEPPTPESLEAARIAIRERATGSGDFTLTNRLNELLDGTPATAPLGWIALALAAAFFGLALRHYHRRAPR